MSTLFDRLTEGARERELMARVRSRAFAPDELAKHCLPFFLKVQIQTVSTCNAACPMCGWALTKGVQPQGRMADVVYRTIVEQLRGRGVERTSLYMENEPLLDRDLAARTAYLKQCVPETTAVIFTNGLLLDGHRALELHDAGMDEIVISVVGFQRPAYERYMAGLDFERAMRNLDAVAHLERAGRLRGTTIKIVSLDLPGAQDGMTAFAQRTGFAPMVKPVTNRAGLIDLHALGMSSVAEDSFQACQRPFVKAYILYNGDLVLCNCDWQRTTIIGNVMEHTLEQLWLSPRLMEIRRHHLAGRLPADSLCAKCDYPYLP
ncbi:MAG: SPASM domain-containing protein [Planctomycetota bacterium]